MGRIAKRSVCQSNGVTSLNQYGILQEIFEACIPKCFQLVHTAFNEALAPVPDAQSRLKCNADCHRFDTVFLASLENLFPG